MKTRSFNFLRLKGNILLFLVFPVMIGLMNQVVAQNNFGQEVKTSFLEYRQNNPQFKIYLHTNKYASYHAGESIWFKAYLLDAWSNQPDSIDAAIYVDLVNHEGKTVDVTILNSHKGFAQGDIAIPDSLAAGNYVLRAYNNYLLNHYPDFIFERVIQIKNPIEENFVRRADIRRNRRFNRDLERMETRYNVGLHPESGALVSGLESRVVVYAKNEVGQSVRIQGRLKDERGNLIGTIENPYPGIGEVSFRPNHELLYFAEIDFPDGRTRTYELPPVQPNGMVMKLDKRDNGLYLNVGKSDGAANGQGTYVVLHARGEVNYAEKIEFDNNVHDIFIPSGFWKPGINVVTLVNENGSLNAERPFFVYDENMLSPDIELMEIAKEDSLFLSVIVKIPQMQESAGSFSLSVTELPKEADLPQSNIASHILLTSDVAHRIENPEFFLSSADNAAFLDYHMMINGWRRYTLSDVLTGEDSGRKLARTNGLNLSGKVFPRGSNLPPGRRSVEMSANVDGKHDLRRTETNSQGYFVFDKLDYDGFFKVEITPEVDSRGRQMLVELIAPLVPAPDNSFGFEPVPEIDRGDNWERVKRPVTFTQTERIESVTPLESFYGNADQVIFMDDLTAQYNNVFEVLRGRGSGLNFSGNSIFIRGQGSVNSGNEPIFLIDGVIVPGGTFLNLPVSEISRIEILKGPETAIFGSRGANGAISAITRKGNQALAATFEFVVQGYAVNRDFLTHLYGSDLTLYQYPEYIATHYWEPQMIFDHEERKRIVFPLFTEPGSYLVIFEGVDEKGRLAHKRLIVERE